MVARINPKVEKALREAVSSASRIELDQATAPLAALDDKERAEVLALAGIVTAYVVIDVCDAKWPGEASVRRIAKGLATVSTSAERLRLDTDEIYAYLSRTVLGPERLEDVIPDEPQFTQLPVVVAQQALAVYCPRGMNVWEYLDQIESAIETAFALDTTVLPAAVMRAYMPKPAGDPA